MRILTALIFSLTSVSAFASSSIYDLKIELSLNGRLVASPRVITNGGDRASITQVSNGEKIFMDVTAIDSPPASGIDAKSSGKAIAMKFVVGTISPSGERNILSSPQIIALENEKAEITIGGDQGKQDLSLSVIAVRKSL